MSENAIDKSCAGMVGQKPRITVAPPNVETLKTARRWIAGAAKLLADASNGDEFVDRIAREASVLDTMTEIAIFGQS